MPDCYRRARTLAGACLLLASLGGAAALAADPAPSDSALIMNVQVFDGSGRFPFAGAVRISQGLITGVGQLAPRPGETTIDGGGLALAPGFIDTHSHADDDITGQRGALAAVSQGITTAVVGQDGGSPFPLADWFSRLEAEPVAINLASYSGHNTLREQVMGKDANRRASAAEIEAM
ncbi:MAG: D-aminoacylase, partial [Anaerolineae bacterium]